jgi:guanylate kinase
MLKKTVMACVFGMLLIHNCFIESKFLLILGPSGVGKSTIIKHLKSIDNRFQYVTPFTTRELREGEQDKTHITMTALDELKISGKLLTVNYIYGNYYATPKYIIDNALSQKLFPVLDWPIETLDVMEKAYEDMLHTVYIKPDSLDELYNRLHNDNRDKDNSRYERGKQEIARIDSGAYAQHIDLTIINKKNQDAATAQTIYNHFTQSLEEKTNEC